jgi:isovaleryl-CoA dehydrogenase
MENIYNPSPEHKALREMVRQFSEREVEPQAAENDRTETFNIALFRQLGSLGLLGITVPEEFGGSGMDAAAAVIVHEELSAVDPGFTLAYLAHSMLFANNLARNGSAAQCQKYLPGAASGELIGGMCMSEPAVGTDVLGMQTSAKKDGDSYVINGAKMWITNGAISDTELGDIFLVYAKTGESSKTASLFLVEKGTPGFSLGQKIQDKLGMRASTTAELVFEDCRIPAENLVGSEGEAVKHMMRNLELERLTLAAMSLGIARRSIEIMNRYANERHAFGKPLRHFGQIQRHIAESYAEYMAGKAYVYSTAANLKLDSSGNRLDSDGVKLYAATMAKNVADRAIQVLGGYGYVGEYTVERLWRDSKLLEIGGGTNEAHHKNMTRELSSTLKLD